MPANVVKFGPGTFKLGPTATTIDYSCQVQSMGVNTDKDQGDTVTVLCGDQIPGGVTYTYTLAGTVLQDIATADGLVQYTWEHEGETVEFEFVPTTSAVTAITGSVQIDPLPIGTSDGEFGDNLTSDFEWTCAGKPAVTWPAAA
jgi:hypothetical protein